MSDQDRFHAEVMAELEQQEAQAPDAPPRLPRTYFIANDSRRGGEPQCFAITIFSPDPKEKK